MWGSHLSKAIEQLLNWKKDYQYYPVTLEEGHMFVIFLRQCKGASSPFWGPRDKLLFISKYIILY